MSPTTAAFPSTRTRHAGCADRLSTLNSGTLPPAWPLLRRAILSSPFGAGHRRRGHVGPTGGAIGMTANFLPPSRRPLGRPRRPHQRHGDDLRSAVSTLSLAGSVGHGQSPGGLRAHRLRARGLGGTAPPSQHVVASERGERERHNHQREDVGRAGFTSTAAGVVIPAGARQGSTSSRPACLRSRRPLRCPTRSRSRPTPTRRP